MTSKAAQTAGKGAATLPLTALLSQVLVAFTIEADNELEHRLPHRTTRGPAASSRRGPWLVSLVMWSNFLRFVSADDPQSATPVYVQVADILRSRIQSGQLLPDRPVPSETQLQQEFGVARGTARKAIALLREQGLVVTVKGRGSYVHPSR
jgi:GntR family transcriptional regulator